ncbi:MAG: glycosyltransferase family 2 protein [Solirubrobacterales bacterium]
MATQDGEHGGGRPEVGVSVLTPTLNEEEHIVDTVRCLQAQRLDAPVEFLFVDGRSEDATRELLEGLAADDPRITVLDNPSRGIPFALNIGLRHARGEFVARMDAHTLYPSDYLARGVERLRRGGVEWVSGPQLPHGEGRWSRRIALALETRLGIGGATFRDAIHEIEVDAGYTGVWRRETLVGQGGWDEDWPINEDGELAARIREAGGRIVCIPEMAALYVPRDSLGALARQYLRYGTYRAKTCAAHPASMRRSHVLPPALVLTAAAGCLPAGRIRRPARAGLAAYVLALLATTAPRLRASARDASFLPAVLATMHMSWGTGFWIGVRRFGPPIRALAMLARGALRGVRERRPDDG